MLDLPAIDLEDSPRATDWVELCALESDDGLVSQVSVARAFRMTGLAEVANEDAFEDEETPLSRETLNTEETAERSAEIVWRELNYRKTILGDAYPFTIEGDRLRRSVNSWRDVSAFTMLALADIGRYYRDPVGIIEPNTEAGRLFEKIVEACNQGLLSGSSIRFGWPIEPGWPKSPVDRIGLLGEKLRLPVEHLQAKIKGAMKDRGLDVASRLGFGDDGFGTVTLLTQCATGRHWKTKRGEPSLAAWRNIFDWNSTLVRAVAIPWRLDDDFSYKDAFLHFDAVILDRLRLVSGKPDTRLADDVKDGTVAWCGTNLRRIPQLA